LATGCVNVLFAITGGFIGIPLFNIAEDAVVAVVATVAFLITSPILRTPLDDNVPPFTGLTGFLGVVFFCNFILLYRILL
jgi:hypothetical protein